MDHQANATRSSRLLDAEHSGLLIVDVQQRLLPLVRGHERVQRNIQRLLAAAELLSVDVVVTEQYPERLGGTVPELGTLPRPALPKRAFSAAACEGVGQAFREAQLRQIVVVGIETHVCVLQTALDLLAAGWDVFVVVDAVSARGELDHDVALDRLRDEGVSLTTTESCLFEWTTTSTHEHFKAISALVKGG
ncbi:hydrolase [Roseimaritima ulvae]|uniref:Isochorismatase family protein n=1 Tax=Roseimaritima ulvae TaxID=980254 RepID=A0A5B9QS81_9BACT|nr:hydrolase [Roseimaritima ulvae]QEG41908.1 Isochorismatase family protein [Roseimaritima ulvae]